MEGADEAARETKESSEEEDDHSLKSLSPKLGTKNHKSAAGRVGFTPGFKQSTDEHEHVGCPPVPKASPHVYREPSSLPCCLEFQSGWSAYANDDEVLHAVRNMKSKRGRSRKNEVVNRIYNVCCDTTKEPT